MFLFYCKFTIYTQFSNLSLLLKTLRTIFLSQNLSIAATRLPPDYRSAPPSLEIITASRRSPNGPKFLLLILVSFSSTWIHTYFVQVFIELGRSEKNQGKSKLYFPGSLSSGHFHPMKHTCKDIFRKFDGIFFLRATDEMPDDTFCVSSMYYCMCSLFLSINIVYFYFIGFLIIFFKSGRLSCGRIWV